MPITEFDIAFRLVMSCILGGLIGLERESHDRPAGFRTHILVCAGSTLIMLVSMYGFAGFEGPKDPGRIAAQVVSGIGFLGAGTIIREGFSVKGLTTAASLWVVAGIGLAIGTAQFFAAVTTTALVFLALVLFGHLERRWLVNKCLQRLKLTIEDKPGQLGRIGLFLGQNGVNIRSVTMNHDSDKKTIDMEFVLRIPQNADIFQLIQGITEIDGVRSIDRIC
ncbi:MAG TPA: MgtC/SapB family protein [Selenomonadales bacterium]|nr:MgtC/SapB family protein [Selenomonadales bacterium]